MHTSFARRVVLVIVSAASLGSASATLDAQTVAPTADRSGMSGEQLYRAACVACHGRDGKGQPQSIVGFDTPLPDFTDCGFTTPEADLDWSSVVHKGGTIRALDRRMPSFIDALSGEEIDRVIGHIRGFCTESGWPRGDLNFPRVFFTEKAYPENEAVLTASLSRRPGRSVEHQFLYEHRIGKRGQYEIGVPFVLQESGDGQWGKGIGDVSAALKYVVFDSLPHGFLMSGGGEVIFPTGKQTEGLGGGVTVFEGFGMFGKALPSDGFLQFHAGFEIPSDRDRASREIFWRTAIGKTFFAGRWGRAWSPMVEVLGAKEIVAGTEPEWDVVPQLQVSLSGLQHVLLNVGVRVPIGDRKNRGGTLLMYVLWDWFDGGLFSNWSSQ